MAVVVIFYLFFYFMPLFEVPDTGLAQYPISNEVEKLGSSCDLNKDDSFHR